MRFPRFNLRTALIVTVIAAALAWQGSIVYRRKAAMQSGPWVAFVLDVRQPGREASSSVNPLRALLGDRPVRYVYISKVGGFEADEARLTQLFPEAEIIVTASRASLD